MSKTVSIVLVVTLSMGSGLAAAGQDPETTLDQAVVFYRRGEFDRSRALLQRLLPLQLPAKLHARTQLYLGFNDAAANRLSETRRHFADALRLNPAIAIDRKHLKTEVVEILDQLLWEMRGTLVVETNVKHSTVMVDGRTVGTSPYRGQHRLGRHQIVVHPPAAARRAYLAYRAEVVLAAGARRRLSVRLLPLHAANASKARTPRARSEGPRDGRDGWLTLRRWAWIATAGALASTGTAVGLGFAALGRHDEADAFARTGSPTSSQDQQRHRELIEASERMVTGSNIAWGVAGAMAVTSAVLFVWDRLSTQTQ